MQPRAGAGKVDRKLLETEGHRRRVGQFYADLQDRMDKSQADTEAPGNLKLAEYIAEADVAADHVVAGREGKQDGELLAKAAAANLVVAQRITTMTALSIRDIDRRLKTAFGSIANAGSRLQRLHDISPRPSFVFGKQTAVEAVAKERKKIVRTKIALAPMTQAPEMTSLDDAQLERREDTERIMEMAAYLKKHGKTNLYELTINPHSFAQSVENLFHVAFLTQKSQARITVTDKVPYVESIAEGAKKADILASMPTTQQAESLHLTDDLKHGMLSLSFESFQQVIETFGITRCVLPQRATAMEYDPHRFAGAFPL